MKKKNISYTCYDDMLSDYYGCHKPPKKKRKSVAKSFDNGEILPGKDSESFEEYIVAASMDADGDVFEEYVVQSSIIEDTDTSYLPVSQHQDLQTDVMAPFSTEKTVTNTSTTPDRPDTEVLLEDIKQVRGAEHTPPENSGSLSSKEEDIVNDLQAILSGKKVYDPAAKKTVNREELGKQQSADDSPPSNSNDPAFKNEHAIFDRIAQNMKFANAYNLGTIQVDTEELNNRFNAFDSAAPAPPKREPAPPPKTAAVPVSKEEAFDPTEFLNDLDNIQKQSKSDVVATVTTQEQSSLQMSPPGSGGTDWPPRPANIRPLTSQERANEFGSFTYVPDPGTFDGDGIRVTNNWYRENIIKVSIPQLNGKKFGNHVIQNGTINFHQAGAERLRRLWAAWEAAGLLDRIQTFEGGYAARFIRGTQQRNPRPLSNHAWGTAFDINAPWNGFGKEPALAGQTGCIRELVSIANQQGFFWGGHFNGHKDGMHFELGKFI